MNFKTTYILFGVLGAMLVVFALVLLLGPTSVPDKAFVLPSAQDKTKGEVTPDDVERVTIEPAEGDKIVLEREGEGDDKGWRMKEPLGSAVDRWSVDSLVRQVLGAKKTEADVNDKLKEWGLAPPRRVVTIETKDKGTFTLNLGDKSPGKDSAVVYVTSSDYPKTVMAVKLNEVESAAEHGLDDFRSRDLLARSADDIGHVQLHKGKGEAVVVESEGSGSGQSSRWRFVKPPYGPADYDGDPNAPADKAPTGIRPLLSALAGIKVEGKTEPLDDKDAGGKKKEKKDTGFVENSADDKALEKYGLKSAEGADLVVTVKKSPSAKEETTLLVGKKVDKEEAYYARLAENKHVVKVGAKALEPVRKFLDSPSEARDHDLVRLPEKPDVVRIKYRSGEVIELVRKAPKDAPHGFGAEDRWTLYRGADKKGLVTDSAAVDKLVNALVQKRQVKEFPSGKTDSQLGLDNPTVTVSLWADGLKKEEKKDEKKDDKDGDKKDEKKDDKKKDEMKEEERPKLKSETPDVVLEFSGEVDSEKRVPVKRKTGKELKDATVVKVLDSVLELVRADPLSYLEKTLPPFLAGTDTVTKLVRELDGAVTEVARKGPKSTTSDWVFNKPADLAGRKADRNDVSNLIHADLNGIKIERWVALAPEDLSKWGLKSPSDKLTLTVRPEGKDAKDREVSLLIGKATDDKKGFYAKKSDHDAVFVVSQADVERLKKPLLDLTVLDVQPSQVKAVKLTGWYRLGKPSVIELERKSASNWESKTAGLKVNAERAEKLLAAMRDLKADKFVVYKKGPQASQGLDFKDKALEIEVTLDDKDKTKKTLRIGGKDGDNFHATSSELPGDVFLIFKGEKGGVGGAENIFEKVKEEVEFLVGS